MLPPHLESTETISDEEDSEDEKIATNDSVGQALARTGLSHRVRTSKMKNRGSSRSSP